MYNVHVETQFWLIVSFVYTYEPTSLDKFWTNYNFYWIEERWNYKFEVLASLKVSIFKLFPSDCVKLYKKRFHLRIFN